MKALPHDGGSLAVSENEIDDYLLENDSRFLARVAEAREEFKTGKTIPLEEVKRILGIE